MNKKVLLIVILMIPVMLFGRRIGLYESKHYLSCNVSGGYVQFMENFEEAKTIGGGGGVLGVGYEMRSRGFWFGVNADFQFYNSMLTNQLNDFNAQMNDTEGDLVTYHYKMKQWNESQNALYMNFPVMIGYYSDGGFYFGAGLKFGFKLLGEFNSRLDYKTSATYDRYIEDFENMPNHFYTDYTSKYQKGSNNLIQNFSVCGEIGGEIYNNQFYHYGARTLFIVKMALCFDYGLTNIVNNEEEHPMKTINEKNPSKLDILPLYDSKLTKDKLVRPLYVGLKFTFLLTPKSCRTCPF